MNLSRHHPNPLKPFRLAMAVTCALSATTVMAQQSPPTDDPATEIDRVRVTGSLIKRVEYDSTSPVQVITADTNVSLGQIETSEFLQKSSIAAGATQISHQFGGYVTEGGVGAQTLDLRGLGANRTLILLDGHRPGPAGTRGQVGPFDLNVLPSSIIQRVELLKDGSSSIYGSDAVAGVANIITRKNITEPELTFSTRLPAHGGGEVRTLAGATGWNFDNGGITLSAEWWLQEPLKMGERRFLRCNEDRVWDSNGNRIDRMDTSIVGNEPWCNNMWHNDVLDWTTGRNYAPSLDGSTDGNLPGYSPYVNTTYENSPRASMGRVTDAPFLRNQYLVQKLERKSIYAAADFSFGAVNWNADLLFNRRESGYQAYRQLFPTIDGTLVDDGNGNLVSAAYKDSPDFRMDPRSPSDEIRPIYPFRFDSNQRVDYYFVHTGLDGLFAKTWSWNVDLSYSRSSGVYRGMGIETDKVGDADRGASRAPAFDYLAPGFLDGSRMDEFFELIGVWTRGKTTYDQLTATAITTGELFNLPWNHSGAVSGAFGAEYREFSINDQPPEGTWGLSSAEVTKGDDAVKEIFAELELPLLRGLPGVEALTLNASTRWFDYKSVGNSDSVWKLGLGWQIVPALRLRATKGTSYRAPGLYELYLGNQTGFVGQAQIDPCIEWGLSSDGNLQANCAAAGIPDDYKGQGSSALVTSGGGAGFLQPERSTARTAGLIWTPAFAPLSVALDYYEITVRDQIDTLTGNVIVGSCYGADVYPNNFCNLMVRAPAGANNEFNITNVYATYINVNLQKVRGYDLLARYQDDLGIGKLTIESQFTWITEDRYEEFDSPLAGGSSISNLAGGFGRPKLVGNIVSSLKRGDFTWTWGMDYLHGTKRLTELPAGTRAAYLGFANPVYDLHAERRLYHSVSVHYEQPRWSLLVGVRNLFDAKPDKVSAVATANRYANIPINGTQYDLFGVSLFARVNYKF